MRKLTALIVASGLMLGTANLTHAAETTQLKAEEGKPMVHHKRGGMHHDMMFKDLNLTAEQKQQIRDIMKDQREKTPRPNGDGPRAFHSIIASDSFDRAKAEQEIDKMAAQNKARMLAHMETQNKIYNILTPEQKKQFTANFEKRLAERKAKEEKISESAE